MPERFANKYVPNCVPENLKLHKRDGFLTCIDQLKYSKFPSDPDKYLKQAEIVTFDMIYARRGRYKQSVTDKHYQTVVSNDFKNMPQKEKKKDVSASVILIRKICLLRENLRLIILENYQNVE